VSGKYFWFYASVTLLSAAAIPAAITGRGERLSFKVPDLLILLFCAAAVLITLNHTGRLTNKCLLLIFAMFFYYYLRIFFAGKSKLIYRLCCITFVITGLAEAVWGLIQLYGFTSSPHKIITGSFFNPGPYSGWLAMIFPYALGYVIFNYKTFKRKEPEVTQNSPELARRSPLLSFNSLFYVLNFATVLCIIFILPSAKSRASWLGALGGSAFVGIMYFVSSYKKKITFRNYFRKYRARMIILPALAVILFAVSMVGLFLMKKDSALGRAFTWKIATQTIVKHPFGVGLGNFGGSYGDAQAEYFASGAGSESEEYIAGGVEYAFNDYLQICIETGIIPVLVFLAFVVCVLLAGIRNKNILPVGSLVSLLIFASMSYPFNLLPFVIAFAFLSALCIADNNNRNLRDKIPYPKFAVRSFLIIVPVSIVFASQFSILNFQFYNAYKQWKNTNMLYYQNRNEEAAKEYAAEYPCLQDEIRFLFEYAACLSNLKQYGKSNEILYRAIQINCDPVFYNMLGTNYQGQKEYEQAEQSLKKSINLVPSRLYPHYLLAKLYHEMGLKDRAEAEANIVLSKAPKVKSRAVDEMREELVKLITDDGNK
jgi:tetratricopeptide (TPR) repeat protein